MLLEQISDRNEPVERRCELARGLAVAAVGRKEDPEPEPEDLARPGFGIGGLRTENWGLRRRVHFSGRGVGIVEVAWLVGDCVRRSGPYARHARNVGVVRAHGPSAPGDRA